MQWNPLSCARNTKQSWDLPYLVHCMIFVFNSKYSLQIRSQGCNKRLSNGCSKLFECSSQYSWFSNILKKVIIDHKDEFRKLGVEEKDVSSHSAWKAACSHALVGSAVAPPIVSICLWAMWSKVK